VQSTYDVSPPDGSLGVLAGFIGGDRARDYGVRPVADLRKAALESYAQLFGAKALEPQKFFRKHWAGEEWSRGAPVGIMAPGVMSAHGPELRRPIGGIHWAGTETATYWNGYMEGALLAGERAATEVLAAL
jgi:monoamine oxidase